MSHLVAPFRQMSRLMAVLGAMVWAAIDFNMRGGWRWGRRRRAVWQKVWAKTVLSAMGVRIKQVGEAPSGGLIVPNHLSYLDILVLGALTEQVFLSKSEVRSWPLIGMLTRYAGTLYIDRGKRREVAEKEAAFKVVIDEGLLMTVFLEGTSSDGKSVLPFRSSLLQPAVKNAWPVTPAYLKYECVGGDPGRDVCYWGDMTFGPHLVSLAKVEKVEATVVFGETREAGEDRKELAAVLFDDVNRLKQRANGHEKADRLEERSAVI